MINERDLALDKVYFIFVSEGFLPGCYDMKELHEGLRELISD
jgi:hypothetical protein